MCYNIYFSFYQYIYNIHPNFVQDYYLSKEVLPVFISSIGMGSILNYSILLIGLILGFLVLRWIIKTSFKTLDQITLAQKFYSFGLLGIFIIAGTLIKSGDKALSKLKTVQWTTPRIADSFGTYKKQGQINATAYQAHLFNALTEKPDVYLIFVEAYGAVATLTPECKSKYDQLINGLEQKYSDKGWNVVSNYSKAPIIGGKSWLSFSSVMAGVKMAEHSSYSAIIENEKDFPHMAEYFNQQGYYTYRMNSFKSNPKTEIKIPYQTLDEFWKFDDWIKFKDIPYSGYEYDIFGGIPDQ
ncbi:MAG: hypothetical protein AAGK97_14485, partial [Bacteroidota bacterium]